MLVVVQGVVGGLLQHGRAAVDDVDPAAVLELLGAPHQGLDEVLVRVGPDHPRLRNQTVGSSERKEEEDEEEEDASSSESRRPRTASASADTSGENTKHTTSCLRWRSQGRQVYSGGGLHHTQ